jgi:hypothetical protein
VKAENSRTSSDVHLTAQTNAQIIASTNGSTTRIGDRTPVVVGAGGGRVGHWDERGSQDSTGSHAETDCGTATVAALLGLRTLVSW